MSSTWPPGRAYGRGFTYTIVLNNSATSGIKDLADNVLAPDRFDGTVYFTVHRGDRRNLQQRTGYPVAWHSAPPVPPVYGWEIRSPWQSRSMFPALIP